MKNLMSMLGCVGVMLLAATVAADGAKPVKVKASPADAPRAEQVNAPSEPGLAAAERLAVSGRFDATGFGERDALSERLAERVVVACNESPFSREGLDAASQIRCNAALAALSSRGRRAVTAIVSRLNQPVENLSYYPRTRLYRALALVDDVRVPAMLLAGIQKMIQGGHDDDSMEVELAFEGLVGAIGIDPGEAALIAEDAIEDQWADASKRHAAFVGFMATSNGKLPSKVRKDALVFGLKKHTSKKPSERFLALTALASQSPRVARRLLDQLEADESLGERERDAVSLLSSRLWTEAPQVALPMPPPPKKVNHVPGGKARKK